MREEGGRGEEGGGGGGKKGGRKRKVAVRERRVDGRRGNVKSAIERDHQT